MEHSFDIAIAAKYDIHTAILLKNIFFWIEKNRANEKHCHEGRYWTYNSKKAFAELFPYLTERQIKYTLDKMKKEGLILTGNFNKDPYDKTCWYTLTDMAMEMMGVEVKVAEKPENTHRTKLSDRADEIVQPSDEIVQPIPDNKHTDNKPNIISKKVSKEKEDGQDQKENEKKKLQTYDEMIESYTPNETLRKELKEFLKVLAMKKIKLSNRGLELLLEQLNNGVFDFYKIKMVRNAITKGEIYFEDLPKEEYGEFYGEVIRKRTENVMSRIRGD